MNGRKASEAIGTVKSFKTALRNSLRNGRGSLFKMGDTGACV